MCRCASSATRDVNSGNPPLKSFPTRFNESFNVKFDHAQHMTGAARPQSGCAACHSRVGRDAPRRSRFRQASRPTTSVTPATRRAASRPPDERSRRAEFATIRKRSRAPATNARAFRFAFSHAKHGTGQRLACTDCHRVDAGFAPKPSGEFARARRTFRFDARQDLSHLSQRQTFVWRRPGV